MALGEGFRRFFRRGNVDQDIREELDAHLEMKAADLVAAGMGPQRARAEALARLGDRERIVAACRALGADIERRRVRRESFDTLRQDVRYAARRAGREPRFFALGIGVLALGVGANTAVFGALNDWLLRAPPGVGEPDRVVALYRTVDGERRSGFGHLGYLAYAEEVASFSGLAAARTAHLTLQEADRTEIVRGRLVSANYFDVLRVPMTLGAPKVATCSARSCGRRVRSPLRARSSGRLRASR